jgi:hypothetical protein
MSKQEIENKIDAMEIKLIETKDSASYHAGPVNDALKVVADMMEDQLVIMRDILNRT